MDEGGTCLSMSCSNHGINLTGIVEREEGGRGGGWGWDWGRGMEHVCADARKTVIRSPLN